MTIRSIVSSLAKSWWIVLGAAVLAAAIAIAAMQLVKPQPDTASIRVGLTSASVWPRYQADLESFSNIVNRGDLQASVKESIDGEILDINTETVEGIFVVEVQVSADSPAVAVAATEVLALEAIAIQAEEADGARDEELAVLSAELVNAQDTLVQLERVEEEARNAAIELAAATDEGDFSFEAEALYRSADAQAARATADRNAVEQRIRTVSNQVSDLELRAELPSDRLFVVQDATLLSESAAISGPIPPIAAALFAAIAMGSFVVARDRLRGPVRDVDQIERIAGVPVIAMLKDGVDEYGGERLARLLRSVGPKGFVEVLPVGGTAANQESLCGALEESAGLQLDVDERDERDFGKFVMAPQSATAFVVLVVETGTTTVDEVLREVRILQGSASPLAGAVLV